MILAIPVGLVIGVSLGTLGGGGSILTVPALVYLLRQNAHGATTASLVIVGITALAGSLVHGRAGRVQLTHGLVFGALGVVGSFIGSRLSARVDAHVLLMSFAALMMLAAAAMVRRSRQIASSEGGAYLADSSATSAPMCTSGAPDSHPNTFETAVRREDPDARTAAIRGYRGWIKLVTAASIVGLLTGFFGVGGGFVVVPALVLALGLSMRDAVGTSLVVIAINAVMALAFRITTPSPVDWGVIGVFSLTAIGGSLIGAGVAGRVRPEVLSAAFGLLLVALSLYMTARSLPQVV